MANLSGFVKRLRDIMRNDAGINGDALLNFVNNKGTRGRGQGDVAFVWSGTIE